MTHPVYFDTDLGIDDALALGVLLDAEAGGRIELVGIGSVHGNIDASTAARNVQGVLALAGRRGVPVAVGAAQPLAMPFGGGAAMVHGDDGVGGVALPDPASPLATGTAAELLVRLAHEHAGRLRIVAVGPFTNLAMALELEPRLPELVGGVWLMGGAAQAPGNITAVAEANVANDPEAAARVLGAPWPVVIAPLDVTMEHRMTLEECHALEGTPLGDAFAGMLAHYLTWYGPIFGAAEVALHDPIAAALAVGTATPHVAPRVPVTVDTTRGPGRGQTLFDLRGRYRGHPDVPGASVQVVLSLESPFAPVLLAALHRVSGPRDPAA